MAKKVILLPLVALICFSLNAEDRRDPEPPYNYGLYNYYIERSWLLSPDEYHWYFETVRQTSVQNAYNYDTYKSANSRTQVYVAPVTPTVVVPLASKAPDIRVSDVLPGGVALKCEPGITNSYHFQDLETPDSRLGYQGLAWGTTIAQFQSRFRDAEEVIDEAAASSRVRRFVQHSVDEGIQSRQFLFLDDKLYEVYVLYGYVEASITAEMQERLAKFYGHPVDITRRTDRYKTVRCDIADLYYNHEVQVVLSICDVFDYNNTLQGTIMTCLFSNPQI